jgi:Trk K+ transport system NAD-binding subunit
VDQPDFMPEWLGAESAEELKETVFRNERIFVMTLGQGRGNANLIGSRLRDVTLPEGTLIAMLRRDDELVFPRGDTGLLEGDRLTMIGQSDGISALRTRYGVAKGEDG